MKRLVFGVVILSLLAAFFISSAIYDSIKPPDQPSADGAKSETKGEVKQTKTQPQPEEKPKENEPTTGDRVFAFFLLSAMAVIVIVIEIREKKATPAGPIDWKEAWKQPAFYTIALIVAFCSLTSLFVYPLWGWLWGHQVFFWGTVLGMVVAAHFKTRKSKGGKLIAKIVAILVVAGLIYTVSSTENAQKFAAGWPSWGAASRHNGETSSRAEFIGQEAPMEVALKTICKYESNCQQFESGTKTPLKNREGSSAFGKYQFLESHREPARKREFDLNTEEGQEGYARWLWQNAGKTKHWEADLKGSYRWQTDLMSRGYGPWDVVEGVVTAKPGDEFDNQVVIHPGIYFDWSTDGGAIEVVDQKGDKAKFNPRNKVIENLPYPSKRIEFRSLEDKPVEVRLRFSRRPLVQMSSVKRQGASSAVFYLTEKQGAGDVESGQDDPQYPVDGKHDKKADHAVHDVLFVLFQVAGVGFEYHLRNAVKEIDRGHHETQDNDRVDDESRYLAQQFFDRIHDIFILPVLIKCESNTCVNTTPPSLEGGVVES